jgi:hypothetical protein
MTNRRLVAGALGWSGLVATILTLAMAWRMGVHQLAAWSSIGITATAIGVAFHEDTKRHLAPLVIGGVVLVDVFLLAFAAGYIAVWVLLTAIASVIPLGLAAAWNVDGPRRRLVWGIVFVGVSAVVIAATAFIVNVDMPWF